MTDPAFAALHPVIQHHVVNTLGWDRLRPLQADAVQPLLRGDDALLLAPTAGGKTEAALFPLLTRMAAGGWRGTSLLYVCPLKALLNNLQPRVDRYAAWLGRAAAVRHGDTPAMDRRRLVVDRPDILLTTPESLEAMLVSATVDPRVLLSEVRVVVVDEVHAFAGDDRGWHLLAVLERVARLAGRPLQRVGLSATVGNADALLGWLQGSGVGSRSASVVNPAGISGAGPKITLDYVGSTANAAKIISSLHQGEKRLVFAETRAAVEDVAVHLRGLGVETFVSHSSLAAGERRRAEQAFAEARDCVIVSTSTLELGIDVGDLDRVIQVGAPQTVASFLQRLGRAGRRAGTARNMLFLATNDEELVGAAALLLLWSQGYVEPVLPPPAPRHILGQQLLALALQQHQVGRHTWSEALAGLPLASAEEAERIAAWMLETGHLDSDSDLMFVGPEAERRYGHRHFMEVLSVFSSSPQFTVVHGRRELGTVDPFVLVCKINGPRVIALAGRGWLVSAVDWTQRRVHVELADGHGAARWISLRQPRSYRLMQAERAVLLGAEPAGVALSERARTRLPAAREEWAGRLDPDGTLVRTEDRRTRWWTWAGGRANALLTAALEAVDPSLIDDDYIYDNRQIGLRSGVTAAEIRRAAHGVTALVGRDLTGVRPFVTEKALRQLKFADLLPPDLARTTLEARLADPDAAREVLTMPIATTA